MNKYTVLLVTKDEVDVKADNFVIDYGSVIFFKHGVPTTEEKYPEDINVMAFAPGTWTLVILEGK